MFVSVQQNSNIRLRHLCHPMVLRQSAMNDEEDLEALRLAALQTIRPRFPKVSTPFIRPFHNPNLIAIVPTGPVVISATNGSSTSAKKTSPAPVPRVTPVKESSPVKLEDQQPAKKEKPVERIKLDLDEDVLDFEGDNDDENEDRSEEVIVEEEDEDAVALHADDEDSLEKLMDKMEEELSEEPVKKNVNPTAQKKQVDGAKNGIEKVVPNISTTGPPTTTVTSTTATINMTKARSRSPVPPKRRSRSPYGKKWSPRSRSRSRSPRPRMRSNSRTRSKSPRRRSPRSPLRGRSRTPPPRRGLSRSRSRSRPRIRSRTRSPVFRRSRTPPKYARRSPPPRNTRRSRSRSRSWTSPRRDYRSPPRRIVVGRKRSPSPTRRSLSCERKYRRSISPRKRSLSPGPEKCRRKKSPFNSHRHHHGSNAKRSSPSKPLPQRIQRISPPGERKSSPSSKAPSDSIKSLLDLALEKKASSPVGNTSGEPFSKSQSAKVAAVDSKLEARRRKFESTTLVAALPKKIRLKASSPAEESAEIVIPADEIAVVHDVIKEKLKGDDAKVQAVVEAVVRQLQRQKPLSSAAGESSKGKRRPKSLHSKRGVTDRASEVGKDEEVVDKPKPSAVRFTVADAEKEIRQLKLKKRQIVDLDGDLEDAADTAVVEKHKKNKKKRKKEKRVKKEEVSSESAIVVETEAAAPPSVGGSDLRAEISRRRAERLKGQAKGEAIVRIVQSAFEGVVGKKKAKKPVKEVIETEDEWPKTIGGRRVQVLQSHQKLYSRTERSRDVKDDDSDVEETEVTTLKGGSSNSTAASGITFRGMLQ